MEMFQKIEINIHSLAKTYYFYYLALIQCKVTLREPGAIYCDRCTIFSSKPHLASSPPFLGSLVKYLDGVRAPVPSSCHHQTVSNTANGRSPASGVTKHLQLLQHWLARSAKRKPSHSPSITLEPSSYEQTKLSSCVEQSKRD